MFLNCNENIYENEILNALRKLCTNSFWKKSLGIIYVFKFIQFCAKLGCKHYFSLLFPESTFIQNSHKMVINTANELIRHDFVFNERLHWFFLDTYPENFETVPSISRYHIYVCMKNRGKKIFFLCWRSPFSRLCFQ